MSLWITVQCIIDGMDYKAKFWVKGLGMDLIC